MLKSFPRLSPAARITTLAGLAVLGCVLSMIYVDLPLTAFIHAHTPPWLWRLARGASYLGDGAIWTTLGFALFLVPFLAHKLSPRAAGAIPLRRHAGMMLQMLLSLAASGLAVRLVKFSFGRLRPENFLRTGSDGFAPFSLLPIADSFPSGHSQTIWAAMLSLTFIYPPLKPAYFALALAVSASRLIITKHYLSDVVFGSLLGIVFAMLVRSALQSRAFSK